MTGRCVTQKTTTNMVKSTSTPPTAPCYLYRKDRLMNKCFHCGHESVVWDNDFSFEEYYGEGEGIVHILHCANCGAEIEYAIKDSNSDEE